MHSELARHDRERHALLVPCRGEGNRFVGHLADDPPSSDPGPVEVVDDRGPMDLVADGRVASIESRLDRGSISASISLAGSRRCTGFESRPLSSGTASPDASEARFGPRSGVSASRLDARNPCPVRVSTIPSGFESRPQRSTRRRIHNTGPASPVRPQGSNEETKVRAVRFFNTAALVHRRTRQSRSTRAPALSWR